METLKPENKFNIKSYEFQNILTLILSTLILMIFNNYENYNNVFLILSSIVVVIIGIVFHCLEKQIISLHITTIATTLCIICIFKHYSDKPTIGALESNLWIPMLLVLMIALYLIEIIIKKYIAKKYICWIYSILLLVFIATLALVFIEKISIQAIILSLIYVSVTCGSIIINCLSKNENYCNYTFLLSIFGIVFLLAIAVISDGAFDGFDIPLGGSEGENSKKDNIQNSLDSLDDINIL